MPKLFCVFHSSSSLMMSFPYCRIMTIEDPPHGRRFHTLIIRKGQRDLNSIVPGHSTLFQTMRLRAMSRIPRHFRSREFETWRKAILASKVVGNTSDYRSRFTCNSIHSSPLIDCLARQRAMYQNYLMASTKSNRNIERFRRCRCKSHIHFVHELQHWACKLCRFTSRCTAQSTLVLKSILCKHCLLTDLSMQAGTFYIRAHQHLRPVHTLEHHHWCTPSDPRTYQRMMTDQFD